MAAVNAHKVFCNAPENMDFLSRITIEGWVDQGLRQTRDLIRQHIRDGLRQWQGRITRDQLFEATALRKIADIPALRPKFRMQGSFVYATINDPACKPPQEVDLDDGLFLPIGFFVKNGGTSPMVASKGFFELVENILEPLCAKHGWLLDKSKDSCIRIRLIDGAHIDIPLYAVADEAFARLVEKRASQTTDAARATEIRESLVLDDSIYKALDESEIRLAHRKQGWIESDPRKIEDWFVQAKRIYGDQLARVCRYLKAWRDYAWPESKLSSLSLMQCAVMALAALKSKVSQVRDDVALFEVVKKLPEYFQGDIKNPVIEDQSLNDNWTPEMRQEYLMGARVLRGRVTKALEENTPKAEVLRELKKAFGSRIPDDESLISYEAAAAVVRSYEPAKVPQPHVRRSVSG